MLRHWGSKGKGKGARGHEGDCLKDWDGEEGAYLQGRGTQLACTPLDNTRQFTTQVNPHQTICITLKVCSLRHEL